MANYPFDDQFKTAVSNLPEWGGDAWNLLINYEPPIDEQVAAPNIEADSPSGVVSKAMSDSLAIAGYSANVVAAHLNALLNLPVDDLVELALADQLEDSPALLVLQRSTSREVLAKAIDLCESSIAKERALGVLVLMREPGRAYREEAAQTVARLAAIESEDTVIEALAYALCHLDVDSRLPFLQRAAGSTNPATRAAAAYSLGALSDESAIECKIALSKDPDDEVRNWATFGLYLALEGDQYKRQDIRDALYERVTDPHEETRYEAITGLARCKDSRVIEPLIAALACDDVWMSAIESAKEMADPALYPALIALKASWSGTDEEDELDQEIASWSCTDEEDELDQAIASCSPKSDQK